MSILTLDNALGLIDYDSYMDIVKKNPALIIQSAGSTFVDYVLVSFSNIYVSEYGALNKSRAEGKDEEHVNSLQESFQNGIDYSKVPPVVRWNPQIIAGIRYDYELVCGDHRVEALKRNGITEWVFGLYDFGDSEYNTSEAIYYFQLTENDHVPQKESSLNDVAKIGSLLIKEKHLAPDEKSIKKFVKAVCKNKSAYQKGKIINLILSENGHSPDVGTYTKDSAYAWIQKNTTYTVAGNYDQSRKKYGWTVKEGYEDELLMNAIKKYGSTKKGSYFVCHTKAPTTSMTLQDKRDKMIESFESLESDLMDIIHYYNKHQKFPWNVEGFMPQDHATGEKSLITIQE
jgi:hypothetical protein